MYRVLRAAALAAAALVASSTSALAQAAPPPVSWTAADCQTCHENTVTTAFTRTAHATLAQQCESCHNGAGAHLASQSKGEQNGPVPSIKKLDQKAQNDICLTCHEKGARTNWSGGMHDRRDTGCTTCHGVHNFKSTSAQLKTVRDSETCFTCHKQMRAKMERASHHPVREGKMECSSCHNPHDSTQPKMISASSVNEKCYQCHTEKRGPFLWDHAPVRENCVQCHDPHGSNHPRLTVVKQPQLCQRCHMRSGHNGVVFDQTSAVGGPTVAAPAVNGVNQVAISARTLNRGCANCHITTHGSNSPNGVWFTR